MQLLDLSFSSSRESLSRKYIALPHVDAPRVIIPISSKRAFTRGFQVHNTSSLSNRVFKVITIFLFFILPFIRSKVLYSTTSLDALLSELKVLIEKKDISEISVYVGTRNSKNQKLTVQLMDSNYNIIGYTKIADNRTSALYLKNECDLLNVIDKYGLLRVIYPRRPKYFELHKHTFLFLEDIFGKGYFTGCEITRIIFRAALELAQKTKSCEGLAAFFAERKEEIRKLPLERRLIELILKNMETVEANNVPNVLVHGDYAPYNMKIRDYSVALIDWEYATHKGLPLFDLFTFVYEGRHQILNERPKMLVNEVLRRSGNNRDYFQRYLEAVGIAAEMVVPLFILYLTESLLLSIKRREDVDIDNNHYTSGLRCLLRDGGQNR